MASTPRKSPGPRGTGGRSSVSAPGVPSITVGFVGLGAMGTPMAANLVRSGFRMRVWNRTAERTMPLVRLGAVACETAGECARDAQVVITMVSDKDALAAVLAGDHGILAGLGKRTVVVDMSTVGRAAARQAARAVEGAGGRFVDAPVSGSVRPAERGELIALVGGRLKDVARVEPVLARMCKRLVYAGEVGQGQALKVVLNGVGAHHLVAFTSMLVLGERAGLRREAILDAFTSGAFASPSYVGKKPKVLARDYSPEFSLALTLKDCAANAELQREVDLELPVHRACMREIEAGVREGLGDEDLFALEKHFETR